MVNPRYVMLHLSQPAGNVGSFTADDNGRATFQLVFDRVKVNKMHNSSSSRHY